MATELIAGTSQLRLASFNTQRLEQLGTSIAGELVQVAMRCGGALVICNVSDRQARGNHAKPFIEGSEFAQERLEGRFMKPSFLWSRRILERLQAIQNKQGSVMRDESCESLALLPARSEPWIGISKPSESRVKKFIRGRSASTGALSVKGPTKD